MHHRGLQEADRWGLYQGDSEFAHAAAFGGPVEKLRNYCIGILEAVASIFALNNEVFVRKGFGRRYFSFLGVCATYILTPIVYYVALFLLELRSSSLKLGVVVDPLGLRQAEGNSGAAEPANHSPETMFLALKLFLVVALLQKLLCYWRKLQGTEPELSVYGGDSIFSGLLAWVPKSWMTRLSFTKDDFVKRWIEPGCCYLIGGWVIPALTGDVLTGWLIQYSAIAMLIRAWCIRWRFQTRLDDIKDGQLVVSHAFEQLDENRSGHRTPVRISLN